MNITFGIHEAFSELHIAQCNPTPRFNYMLTNTLDVTFFSSDNLVSVWSLSQVLYTQLHTQIIYTIPNELKLSNLNIKVLINF